MTRSNTISKVSFATLMPHHHKQINMEFPLHPISQQNNLQVRPCRNFHRSGIPVYYNHRLHLSSLQNHLHARPCLKFRQCPLVLHYNHPYTRERLRTISRSSLPYLSPVHNNSMVQTRATAEISTQSFPDRCTHPSSKPSPSSSLSTRPPVQDSPTIQTSGTDAHPAPGSTSTPPPTSSN